VWQTIPDDKRSIAECPIDERCPMAIELETILPVTRASYTPVLLERRAEDGQTVWL